MVLLGHTVLELLGFVPVVGKQALKVGKAVSTTCRMIGAVAQTGVNAINFDKALRSVRKEYRETGHVSFLNGANAVLSGLGVVGGIAHSVNSAKNFNKMRSSLKSKSGIASDELIHVYRGTNKYAEISAFDETGHLMSDATRNLYFETGNLEAAYVQSGAIHDSWLRIWGNENDFVQAHGAFGTELSQAFGLDRTFMSVTTDPDVARRFARTGGRVFEAYIPKSQLIKQTLSGAGESEYLIRFGLGGFE